MIRFVVIFTLRGREVVDCQNAYSLMDAGIEGVGVADLAEDVELLLAEDEIVLDLVNEKTKVEPVLDVVVERTELELVLAVETLYTFIP